MSGVFHAGCEEGVCDTPLMAEARQTLRRAAPAVLGLLALFALVSCAAEPSVEPEQQPSPGRDLILVTVDTLRPDALGAYDPDAGPTPSIDALADRGLVFTQAMAPMPRTTPALATLLTGRSPQVHGSREVAEAMSSDVPLLSQILGRLGASSYLTLGVSASQVAAADQGLARGFDVFRLSIEESEGEAVTRTALDLLREALAPSDNADRPLFLWVHYLEPHFPYLPLDDAGDVPDACQRVIGTAGAQLSFVYLDHDGVSSRALDACVRRYHGEVARVDRHVGRLFNGLREMGRPPEEALVVFTADHGEHLGEAGYYYKHGPSLHDAALRVPLIVAGPGIATGRRNELVELQDVAPTVLELVGVPEDVVPPMDGRSLADRWLVGAEAADQAEDVEHVAFAESGSNLRPHVWTTVVAGRAENHCVHDGRWSLCGAGDDRDSFRLFDHEADPRLQAELIDQHLDVVDRLWRQRQTWPPESARERAVRTARFKLLETPRPEGGYERRLYDLQTDPAESTDVSAQHPEVAERLGRRLDEIVANLPAPGHVALEDEDLESLRALGYVE